MLGLAGWGAYASARYRTLDQRLTTTLGVRLDGSSFSARMARFWEHISPTWSVSWRIRPVWALNAAVGLYHQLPAYTSLGYKDEQGRYANKTLDYMRVANANLGTEWNITEHVVLSVEGFYKYYSQMPLSVADGIPLSCKGNDYGVVGNELLVPDASGRAYGVEAAMRWQIPGRLTSVASFTYFRSECRSSKEAPYMVSSRYNAGRLDAFAQLDLRIDKNYYFRHWRLGIYLDLQNVTKSVLRQPDVLMSTGVIANPDAPVAEQRYIMKHIRQESGTLLPTLGLTAEF